MLRITGYSDTYTSFPGDEIKFYVNSEKNENYEVQIVRLIHGDTNPEGPGYKEEEIGAECNRNYQGKNQKIHDFYLLSNNFLDYLNYILTLLLPKKNNKRHTTI